MNVHLQSSMLSVTIKPLGAELCSVKNTKGTEYIWQAQKDIWPRHAPVLFPIVGKLKNDSYTYQDQSFKLPQHGFARDLPFHLISSDESACTFRLKATQASKRTYPFDFILDITYKLQQNRLETVYRVQNPSSGPIYFSIGAHPGFNCPLLAGESWEEYYLQFETKEPEQTLLQNGLLSGQKNKLQLPEGKLYLSAALFDKDALVFEKGQISSISLVSSASGARLSMHCPNWPNFGIWSKAGHKNFICLEPWQGIADEATNNGQLEHKKGIQTLAPQYTFTCSFTTIFE
jgi:galactose mutarotase-like enzyme